MDNYKTGDAVIIFWRTYPPEFGIIIRLGHFSDRTFTVQGTDGLHEELPNSMLRPATQLMRILYE